MLAAKSGDPNVIGRNRRSCRPKFGADCCVRERRLVADFEDLTDVKISREPLLISLSVSGLLNTETVLAEDNNGYGHPFRLAEYLLRSWVSIRRGGQRIRIGYHV